MYFLNLSLFQFLAVFGSISAISVALYLLDRSRRKLVVSTLRFWVAAEQPAVAARRRRIQQPWSLLLQLVSMALLILAIAQLRMGTPEAPERDAQRRAIRGRRQPHRRICASFRWRIPPRTSACARWARGAAAKTPSCGRSMFR